MSLVQNFRNRLQQINTEIFEQPIPEISAEMARTTNRLRAELGDISRGLDNKQGIDTAVLAYFKTQTLPYYQYIKCVG